jgi:hypothetical protein
LHQKLTPFHLGIRTGSGSYVFHAFMIHDFFSTPSVLAVLNSHFLGPSPCSPHLTWRSWSPESIQKWSSFRLHQRMNVKNMRFGSSWQPGTATIRASSDMRQSVNCSSSTRSNPQTFKFPFIKKCVIILRGSVTSFT